MFRDTSVYLVEMTQILYNLRFSNPHTVRSPEGFLQPAAGALYLAHDSP